MCVLKRSFELGIFTTLIRNVYTLRRRRAQLQSNKLLWEAWPLVRAGVSISIFSLQFFLGMGWIYNESTCNILVHIYNKPVQGVNQILFFFALQFCDFFKLCRRWSTCHPAALATSVKPGVYTLTVQAFKTPVESSIYFKIFKNTIFYKHPVLSNVLSSIPANSPMIETWNQGYNLFSQEFIIIHVIKVVYGRHKLHSAKWNNTTTTTVSTIAYNRFQINLINYLAIKTIYETKAVTSKQNSLLFGVEPPGM